MSEIYEVVIFFREKYNAEAFVQKLKFQGYITPTIRKVNPDAHPVAGKEEA